MTKVLLVEDDKSLREIYAVRLVEEGYDIVSAGDGEEALAMAIKERPGLIISDVMMPKISGFDMLDILRSTTETKNIKVIMMTALSSEDQRERGVSLGADRYLVKSQVGIEDVVRTVHEVLADAPVAGQTPLMASTAPAAVAPPVTPVTAGPGAQISAPATAPTPTSTPSVPPRTATPVPAPRPTVTTPTTPSAPAQAVPTPQPPASPSLANGSTLPQPTAPFSTPRTGTLAGRVIEPLKTSEGATAAPSISTMMEKELSGSSIPPQPSPELPTPPTPTAATAPVTPPPVPPVPPIPVAPIASTPADLSFEETPRPSIAPAPASSATPVAAPQPPATPGSV